jgi:uncharacterized protein YoxC
MEKLTLFFNRIKEITFWQRIFSWGVVRKLSYEAYEEFRDLDKTLGERQRELENLRNEITRLNAEKNGLDRKVNDMEKSIIQKDVNAAALNQRIDDLSKELNTATNRISKYESLEEKRNEDYSKKIAQLDQVKTDLDNERNRLNDERLREKEESFERMKRLWSEHESMVEQRIKQICSAHIISYVDKVPFRGSPDNAIEICGEYIIFDAKSPANDDLTNFPKYIKTQTDNVKKYANQESVRKDIFLVIPSNTIESIGQLTYNMGDYNVYVITIDALEPIILSLKKIEEYEFAEQLSPEDRDNICRVIGKFAHTTKRKIQIDQFFANQFIELLVKCKNDLPEDILQSVVEFEKAEKLNPPTEKRSKQILTKDLQDKNDSINAEAQIRNIDIPNSFDDIKRLE